MSFIKLFIVTLIKCYQATVSVRQPVCRFNPTCSHYALEAIDQHGVIHGAWLGLKRLVKCHPFSSHGYDPVPVKKEILV